MAEKDGEKVKMASRDIELEHTIRQREDTINSLEQATWKYTTKIKGLELEKSNLERELSSIKSSVSWQILRKLSVIARMLMPANTRRRKIFFRCYRAVSNITHLKSVEKSTSSAQRPPVKNPNLHNEKAGLKTMAQPNMSKWSPDKDRRYITDLFSSDKRASPHFIPLSNDRVEPHEEDVRLIAFYSPQFYALREKDVKLYEVFAEWRDVSMALPQYNGHYQPRLPDELGFYDLGLLDIQRRQVELARQFGIYGFCFNFYWLNGKKLFDRPLTQLLLHQDIDFPFCICWANENLIRRRKDQAGADLLSHVHTVENDAGFIRAIEPFIKDSRYIRIDSKPLVIVNMPQPFPHAKEIVREWRRYCAESGIGEIYLVAAKGSMFADPRDYGFDAGMELHPDIMYCKPITDEFTIFNPKFSGQVFCYQEYVDSERFLRKHPYVMFKNVSPSWDNTAIRPDDSTIYWGSYPEYYKKWLLSAIEFTKATYPKEERIVFIYAWNEWAEGAYLEPDRMYGYGYLQATAEAIREARKKD